VGIVEVCALTHPDSTADKPAWECVDIRAIKWLPRHVTLDEIKREAALSQMVLVNNSRLSVQPVSEAEWEHILAMAG
jgi:predicted RNA-binding protein with PUA-like domain